MATKSHIVINETVIKITNFEIIKIEDEPIKTKMIITNLTKEEK